MGHKKRKIACMTGTRADYPRVKTVLREIERRANLELKLIVTGMHLLPEYGNTIEEIKKDGFEIEAIVPMFDADDSPYGMAKAAARCSAGIADVLKDIKPDIFLLTVDRVETLAAAQSAALMNIPIAHIQGGEVTGTVDESIRHAVTKLAHIHFPATKDAGDTILKMGELPENVHVVGCPYVDIINNIRYKSKKQLAVKYDLNPELPWVIFTQHPVTTEYGEGIDQISVTIKAINCFKDIEVIALYSNADAGGREIVREMRKHKKFKVFPNIISSDFLSIMKYAAAMVGNSSAGIREAPSFNLPVVNIGTRQSGRLRAANVIDVDYDFEQIKWALSKALYDIDFRKSLKDLKNPYGDGNAAKRIVDILETVKIDKRLVQKRISYSLSSYRKVLVTGGAGCIGLAVCAELSRRGIPVCLYDLPEQIARVTKAIPKGVEIYYGSILDICSLRDAMAGADAVIHLAAYLGVRRTETNRLRCIEVNIDGTKNVLDCMIQQKVKKIIFASSSEVYGEPLSNPVDETFPTIGKTVYAVTKLTGEELCRAYAQKYPEFNYTILRYFNTYGPYQIAQFVIPKFIRNVAEGHPPVIYGDGKQKRSYCYVDDTARATVDALLTPKSNGEVFNIGNSLEPVSLIELAELVIRICGKKRGLKPIFRKRFKNADREESREIFERYCNTRKAEALLGYKPAVMIKDGIKKVSEQGVLFPKWATTDICYTLDDWM